MYLLVVLNRATHTYTIKGQLEQLIITCFWTVGGSWRKALHEQEECIQTESKPGSK